MLACQHLADWYDDRQAERISFFLKVKFLSICKIVGICHISPYRELGVHPARSPLILQVSPAGSKTSQTKPDVELILQI